MSAKSSTKSIAILADKSALNMYTLATIRHLCSIFGVAEAGADEADVLWVFPTRSAGRSAWRTALHRCTPEEALELPPEPKDTNVEESFRNFRAGLDGRGLGFLLDGSRKLNEAAIKTRIK